MPKKSKPKQRTNWKARALHIQTGFNALSQAHTGLISAYNELSLRESGFKTRAESAEKHNALLLEERDRVLCQDCLRAHDLPPTHWQRFKSFLKHWYVDIITLIVVFGILGAFVRFVWKQGG